MYIHDDTMKARQDELLRVAARDRLAVTVRRARRTAATEPARHGAPAGFRLLAWVHVR